MRTPTQAEIDAFNQVIRQCQRLIAAHGQQNLADGPYEFGQYETAAFSVIFKRDPPHCGLQVTHRGMPVLEVSWDLSPAGGIMGTGRAWHSPGPWREALLALPTPPVNS